jgi:hypothetical protein
MTANETAQAREINPRARQFADIAEVRSTTKGFLTREEELDLIETGIRDFGLPLAEARGIVQGAADGAGVPRERDVERTLGQWLKAASGRRKRLSRAQFQQAAQVYRAQAGEEMEMAEIERRVKALMEDGGIEPRRAGLLRTRRWYHRI